MKKKKFKMKDFNNFSLTVVEAADESGDRRFSGGLRGDVVVDVDADDHHVLEGRIRGPLQSRNIKYELETNLLFQENAN
jgi:hypothetical protein